MNVVASDDIHRLFCRNMTRKLLIVTCILLLILFFQSTAWGFKKTGPADFTVEPLLSSEWICYIQENDLYAGSLGNPSLKIRESKEAGVSLFSPQLIVSEISLSFHGLKKVQARIKLFSGCPEMAGEHWKKSKF